MTAWKNVRAQTVTEQGGYSLANAITDNVKRIQTNDPLAIVEILSMGTVQERGKDGILVIRYTVLILYGTPAVVTTSELTI